MSPEEKRVWGFIDMDVICYHACPYDRTKLSNQIGTIDDEGNIVYSEEEDKKYLDICWRNAVRAIEEITEKLWLTDWKGAVKGPKNFRDEVFDDYKGKRTKDTTGKSTLGQIVPILRQMLVDDGIAIEADNMEADDYLRIWAEEARASGDDFYICSIDKDLRCIPGKHYHLKTKTVEEVDEQEAMNVFYGQLLSGDSVDNIPGVPGIGPKTAARRIEGITEEDELQIIVCDAYYKAYGDEWKENLMMNGQLLYLLKTFDDKFTMDGWPDYEDLI